MNALALKNIQIFDDIAYPNDILPAKAIRLSLISIGEFKRLNLLCFPGASQDISDNEESDNADDRPGIKGLRRKSIEVSE
jgi:hypothetical protein